MNEHREAAPRSPSRGRLSWAGWTVALLVVAVMVYLLALPPIFYGMVTKWGTAYPSSSDPIWWYYVAQPYNWACQCIPLLKDYGEWWRESYLEGLPVRA